MLTPDHSFTACGVTVNTKIIPDGTRWKDGTKAAKCGFKAGSLYKKQAKLSGGTGKVQSVTIHNTGDLAGTYEDAEQYVRATFNENMNDSRVHFFVDDVNAWQNLKAGHGVTPDDPLGAAEVGWHAGDGSSATGGNMTSLSIEVIMGDTADHDAKAKDNGARLAAWLLWRHGLTTAQLVTHTYWVNKSAGKSFTDLDTQCTNPIKGRKWCPTYIFASSNAATAKKNWLAFKALVKGYLDQLNGTPAPAPAPAGGTMYRVRRTWEDAKSQIGAYTVLENAKRMVDNNPGYTVFDATGAAVYPVAPFEPYKAQVTVDDLHIRSGPGTAYTVLGVTGKGVFTIVEEKPGDGSAAGWGLLKAYQKNRDGWIALDHVTKL